MLSAIAKYSKVITGGCGSEARDLSCAQTGTKSSGPNVGGTDETYIEVEAVDDSNSESSLKDDESCLTNTTREETQDDFTQSLEMFTARFGPSAIVHEFVELPFLRGTEEMAPLMKAAQECNAWIAGGAVRWMCSPSENPARAGDVDIFPSTRTGHAALCERLEGLGYERMGGADRMAVTFARPELAPSPAAFVQVVAPRRAAHLCTVAASPRELLPWLDFTVARAAVAGSCALVDVDFARDEKARRLVVKHVVCPLAAVRRVAKYAKKGYRCPGSEVAKLFAEWSRRAALPPGQDVGPADVLRVFADPAVKGAEEILAGVYVD